MGEVAVLNPDQIRFTQREVEVEVDQAVQRRGGVSLAGSDLSRTGEQAGADANQQLDQQRLLVGEMPIDRRAADTRWGPDVFQPPRPRSLPAPPPETRVRQTAAPLMTAVASAGPTCVDCDDSAPRCDRCGHCGRPETLP